MGTVVALLCAVTAATLTLLAATRGRWGVTTTGVACTTVAAYVTVRLYVGVVLR